MQARWTVEVERTDTGERRRLTCGFLMSCTGYYRYDEWYAAKFPGMEPFPGRIVHPQHWPEDLDYAGKQVVVIGSGATAVTLVPATAQRAALVTMLQRSPSYVLSLPARDPVADWLRRVLPAKVAYWLIRWKNVLLAMLIFQISRRQPQRMKALIRKGFREAAAGGLRHRHPLQPALQPLGPAPLSGPGRRPLRRDPPGTGVDHD